MRKCPICKNSSLREIELNGNIVDRCNICYGIYFDQGELESVIHLVRLFCAGNLEENEIDTITINEKERKIHCPEDGTLMNKQDIMDKVIDVCPLCKGIWLDNGEILALKNIENHIKQNLNLYIKLGQ